METTYGEVKLPNGKMVTLTQQPYLDENNGLPVYKSHVQDEDENDYMVIWEVLENFPYDDSADDCDWEDYSVEQI